VSAPRGEDAPHHVDVLLRHRPLSIRRSGVAVQVPAGGRRPTYAIAAASARRTPRTAPGS
jgi:hypothetical protein